MTGNGLEINYVFDGLSDTDALHAEIATMRGRLEAASAQMALERRLAMAVHHARSNVVLQTPILEKIVGKDTSDGSEPTTAASMLTSAFLEEVNIGQLPEQVIKDTGKKLRIDTHPDVGGDAKEAANIAMALDGAKVDPVFSIMNAVLAAKTTKQPDIQNLRNERYKLQMLLDAATPHFDSQEDAESYTNKEIDGAEWRIRTVAAFKCFELIIGSPEKLQEFLQQIAAEKHRELIAMINLNLPLILTLNERMAKGDPITLSKDVAEKIDESLELIWDTLNKAKEDEIYFPPYQNWFPILIPILERLDPGIKEGKDYTYFKPPFEYVRTYKEPDLDKVRRLGKSILSFNEKYNY
jgi:hypothetical protein